MAACLYLHTPGHLDCLHLRLEHLDSFGSTSQTCCAGIRCPQGVRVIIFFSCTTPAFLPFFSLPVCETEVHGPRGYREVLCPSLLYSCVCTVQYKFWNACFVCRHTYAKRLKRPKRVIAVCLGCYDKTQSAGFIPLSTQGHPVSANAGEPIRRWRFLAAAEACSQSQPKLFLLAKV